MRPRNYVVRLSAYIGLASVTIAAVVAWNHAFNPGRDARPLPPIIAPVPPEDPVPPLADPRGPNNPTPPARPTEQIPNYPWLDRVDAANLLVHRIAVPEGYTRVSPEQGSFGAWLQRLPLKAGNPPVRLFDGTLKRIQDVHVAVIDIDTGNRDLQQCADSVMRLRGEYLFSQLAKGMSVPLSFASTSGAKFDWSGWAQGERPFLVGNKVTWRKSEQADASHANFRRYMDKVFQYAGTLSLAKELQGVRIADLQIGDVFVHGGSPGHASIVVDVAQNAAGKKILLLAEGYMPAQDMHIVKNPNSQLSPWYSADFGASLKTPEYTFKAGDLKRFR